MKQDAEKLLADRLAPYNIIVQDFNIVDFQWASQDFVNAIRGEAGGRAECSES